MKRLFEIYESLVTESFNSKLVRMFANDSLSYSKSFSEFCKRVGLYSAQWDRIEDSDIVEVKKLAKGDFDVTLRMIRACRAGKDSYIGLKGKREAMPIGIVYIFGYNEDDRLCMVYSNSIDSVYTLSRSGSDSFERIDSPRSIDTEIEKCSTLYIVALNDKDTRKVKSDRNQSRRDMIPDLDDKDRALKHNIPGILGKQAGGADLSRWGSAGAFFAYCSKKAEENMKRYRETLALNKFAAIDTSAIDKMVRENLERYQEIMKRIISASSKDSRYISIYNLNDLINGTVKSSKYSENGWIQGGLLHLYSKYMSVNVDLARQKNKDSSYSLAETYMKDLKSYEAGIKSLCARLANEFNKIEEDLK